MKTSLYLILILALMVSLAGCDLEAGADYIRQEDSPSKESAENGLNSLPCFKCHSYADFVDGFAHDIHINMMKLHCTQCHTMKAHKEISLNDKSCGSCHNVDRVELNTSSMPVSFNHREHAGMLNCGDCHNKDTFPFRRKGNRLLTMDDMQKRMYCGKCHDGKAAFASSKCGRCHTNT